MKENNLDFIIVSPLLLLILLPASGWFVPYITQTAVHPEIALLKYFSIPLIGFSMGSVLFLGIIRKSWMLPDRFSTYVEKNTTQIISLLACIFLVYLSSLAVLRYMSLHTFVFDMGTYDKKIWQISIAPLSRIPFVISMGHFQPILIFYALLYKVMDSPVIIQTLQAVAIISGVIPLYLTAKEQLHKPLLVFAVTVIYLLYPPVEFNAALDFHPDHLYAPLLLWAFYFAERGNYWKSIIFAGLGTMIKEPLIIGTAFFGLYLILAKKRTLEGALIFTVFILMFYVVVFIILPTNQSFALKTVNFPFMNPDSEGFSTKAKLFTNALLMCKTKKLLFIYFTLAPLLFLPLLDWKRFLPAIPLIAIPLMSTTGLHSTPDSQYTAGIIAPAFVALIFSIKRIENHFGVKYVNAVIALMLIMTLTFNIANGPSLLSINIWRAGWSEIWHRSAFMRGEQDKALREAIFRIPADPTIIVNSQGNINHARLAHRYNYWAFPHRWEEADYIILDTNRSSLIYDQVDHEIYKQELQKLENDPRYNLEFEQDSVFVYKRLKRN